MELIRINDKDYIQAKDLYIKLGIKRQYSQWIRESIKRAELEQQKDFLTNMLESTGGRPSIGYLLTRDSAISITVMSGGKFASSLRKEIIELYTQTETGKHFSSEQINFMLELVPVMGLFSIQDISEKKHFDFHNNKYDWWDYRAKVLGYGTEQLKLEVEKLNHKYKSQKQALLHVDKYELIRIGVIDLFIALGKSVEYACNVANLCKNIAEKTGANIWNDYNTSINFSTKHNKRLESAIKTDKLRLSK
jgi:phage anti-repressor protein